MRVRHAPSNRNVYKASADHKDFPVALDSRTLSRAGSGLASLRVGLSTPSGQLLPTKEAVAPKSSVAGQGTRVGLRRRRRTEFVCLCVTAQLIKLVIPKDLRPQDLLRCIVCPTIRL